MAEERSELDPEKLLLRLSQGEELSSEEVDTILSVLESVNNEDLTRKPSLDLVYGYLVVLCRAKIEETRYIVERFLDARDALTVAHILEALCLEWNLTEEYLERVLSFSLGVSWDEEQDVQQVALRILGEYLNEANIVENEIAARSEQCVRVLDLLFSTVDDQYSESWTRQAAYYALCRACRISWEDLPAECVLLNFEQSEEIAHWSEVSRLRKRIA